MTNSTKAIVALITFLIAFGLTLGFTIRAHADDAALYKALDFGLTVATNQPTQTIQEGLEAEVAQAKSNYEFRTGQKRFCPPLIQKTRPPIITAKQIYWITRLDPINGALRTSFMITVPAMLLFAVLWLIGYLRWNIDVKCDKDHKDYNSGIHTQMTIGRRSVIALVLLITTINFTMALLPSTKEMAMIQITPVIVNSDFVQEDLPREAKELYGLAKSYFQEAVEKK